MDQKLRDRLLHGISDVKPEEPTAPMKEALKKVEEAQEEQKQEESAPESTSNLTVDTSQHAKRLMTVTVHVKLWEGKRTDKTASADVIERAKANQKAGRFIKNLINRDKYIKPLEQIRTRAKAMLYKYTMSWAYGVRVITVDAYPTLRDEIKKLQGEYAKAVDTFIFTQYDIAKKEAEVEHEGLGALWSAADYPNAAELRDKFVIEFDVTPFPTEVALDLPESMKDEIRRDMEKAITDRTRAAVTELVDRLEKALSDFGEKVQKDPKKWRDSTVTNLREILDIAPMLNVTGDPKITEAINVAKMRLSFLDKLADADIRNQSEEKRAGYAKDALTSAANIKHILLS